MPEIPDLTYITHFFQDKVLPATISGVRVRQPVVVRNFTTQSPETLLVGTTMTDVDFRGPFIRVTCSRHSRIIINLMVAGRLQHQRSGEKSIGHLCLSVGLANGDCLDLSDEKKLATVYLVRAGEENAIPKSSGLGVDILSPEFTPDRFRELVRMHGRKQVRVFMNDHAILNFIGNAYADEILFEARIHPRTFVGRLGGGEVKRLHGAITSVTGWGMEMVNRAGQPIHVKVRDHMNVRNRKGLPCLRCGTKIRREGIRGHDVFCCPVCQQQSRRLFLDWRIVGRSTPDPASPSP